MIERAESSGNGVRREEFLGRVSFTLDLPVSLILRSCQLSFKRRGLVSVSSNKHVLVLLSALCSLRSPCMCMTSSELPDRGARASIGPRSAVCWVRKGV